jgi:hypothetical protein
MLYNVILFIHVLGTVIMYAAVGITLSSMIAMLYSKKNKRFQDLVEFGR